MQKEERRQPQGALAGTRVVDLSRVLAGPLASQMLSDHGADVIKIEPPRGDETRTLGPPFVDESAAYYHALNRNKRGIALDLTKPAARDVLFRLLEDADILVENFLPGTMEGWGLGYDDVLSKKYPRLIYCRISGFGLDGPLGGLPGYDAVLQAQCGLMSINGHPDTGMTRIGIAVVDIATGMSSTIGILLALAERSRSGQGQLVDLSLYDVGLSLLIPHAANWVASNRTPKLSGSGHANLAPYDKYRTTDGEIFLGVVNDGQFRKLCRAMGRDELGSDARFRANADRVAHRDVLRNEIETMFAGRKSAELCASLMAVGVPAGPVSSVPEAMTHRQTTERGMAVELDGYRGIGIPARLSRTPGAPQRRPPKFAEHTHTVLAEAGYSSDEIGRLVESGAVLETPRR
ncbi:MAG: CoA transferase [Betaproteobacteria bacterium]|nr:CoA transferase [Betaproteobacteria bacterium]